MEDIVNGKNVSAAPYLKVEDIYKNFGANKVLKGISFDLRKGEVLAIIGSSGSGKTTLLRCITFWSARTKACSPWATTCFSICPG